MVAAGVEEEVSIEGLEEGAVPQIGQTRAPAVAYSRSRLNHETAGGCEVSTLLQMHGQASAEIDVLPPSGGKGGIKAAKRIPD
jgi:hypothetical protein